MFIENDGTTFNTAPGIDSDFDGDNDYVSTIFLLSQGEKTYEIEIDEAVVISLDQISVNPSDNTESVSRETVIQQQRTLFDSLLSNYYRQKVDIAINEELLEDTYSANSIQ